MRRAHGRRGPALALAALLAGTGCGAQAAGQPEAAGSIVIGVADGFTSYNPQSERGRTATNAAVLSAVAPGFWRPTPAGEAAPDTAVGTYRKLSDDPLRVVYTFAPGARWSDGEPLDCDDAWLAWAANSGRFGGFEPADAAGYSLIQRVDCADGQSAFTVTFSQPFADWQTLFGSLLPAHIAEAQSGVPDVIAAADSGDAAQLEALAEFWSGGWQVPADGTADPTLMPSAGPYRIAEVDAGAVVLVANDQWWGSPPTTARVEFAPGRDSVAALAAGEVDALAAAPTAAALNELQLAALPYAVGSSFAVDSLVFNVRGAAFARAQDRRAFAACVPRERIVSDLYRPLAPAAAVLKSNLLLPFQAGYDQVRAVSLRPQHVAAQAVRLRGRPDAVELIRAGCAPYGFDVVAARDGGAWDAAVVSTQGSPRITQAAARFATDGAANVGGYHSQAVDDLLFLLATTPDRTPRQALVVQLERLLWQDLPALPLAASPVLVAWRPGLTGVEPNPAPGGLTWNLAAWG